MSTSQGSSGTADDVRVILDNLSQTDPELQSLMEGTRILHEALVEACQRAGIDDAWTEPGASAEAIRAMTSSEDADVQTARQASDEAGAALVQHVKEKYGLGDTYVPFGGGSQ